MSNPKDFLEQQANGAVLLAKTEPPTPAPRPNGRDHDEPLSLEIWDAGDDNEPIPPRGWLLGNILCRRFLTAILGDGAVGKTALIIAIALSLATARPLIDEHVFQRCRVLLLCFEDGKDELRRRVRAATLHHGIATDDIKGQLFLSAVSRSSLKLARMTKGAVEVGRLGELIETEIARHQIDVVLFDPFVKTHAVSENDNAAIDFVAEILTALTIRHDIAVGVLHHTRKGAADPGDADAGRGASALKNAARLVYTITGMTDEAKLYNIAEEGQAVHQTG
jgi:RecA-family ATPase